MLLNKKKIYNTGIRGDKYFLLFLFLSFAKPFAFMLQKVNFKFLIDYADKTNFVLKMLEEPYAKLNGYNFIVLQCLSMLSGILLVFFIFGFDVLVILCAGILFFMLPYVKMREERKKKMNLIIKQLPNLSDLLAVIIVSGVDFNNALIKISAILQGVLSHEIKNVISKVSFGIDVKIALKEMADKYNLEQLNLFVRTVNSSLESGLGISDSLNKISEQIKIENASFAEKKAQEAPVKMLIPMTFLILPTIFILLFAPIIISFMRTGSLF